MPSVTVAGTRDYAWTSDARCRRDLRREVALFLLDAFTELETDIVNQRDRLAGFLCRLGHDIGDRGLVVHHEQLAEQRVLLGIFGDRAIDHLGYDLGRLARFGGLFTGEVAFAL